MTELSELGQAALAYARKGLSIIPIQPDAKAPALVEWKPYQEQKADEAQIAEWWTNNANANVAVVTGSVSDLSAIDIDGGPGMKSFQDHLVDRLPQTRIHDSPKGKHMLFRYNADLKQGAGLLPGVDVRNDGGYLMLPPSVVEGKAYRVFRDRQLAVLADPPGALTGKTEPAKSPQLIGNPDWVTKALSKGAPESERNATATRLIGYFHHKGIPADIIEATMLPFAERCTPPMDVAELQRTIQSVTRYQTIAEEQRIKDPPAYQQEGEEHVYTFADHYVTFRVSELIKRRGDLESWVQVTTTIPTHPASLYGPRTWNLNSTSGGENLRRALEKRIPDLDWAGMTDVVSRLTIEQWRKGIPAAPFSQIEGVDPNNLYEVEPFAVRDELNLIYGDGGAGKSLLAMAICVAKTADHSIAGIQGGQFRRCLYLDWEATGGIHKMRLNALMKGHGVMDASPLDNFHYIRMDAPLKDAVAYVRGEISRLGIGFVIVDSIGAAMGGVSLNDAENAIAFANACRALGVTVLAIGHVSKDSDGKSSAKPIGSTYFWNSGRNLWEVQKQQETDDDEINIALYHRKANDDRLRKPIGLSLKFGDGTATYSRLDLSEVPAFEERLSNHERVRRYLLKNGYRSVDQLNDETGIPAASIKSVFQRDRGKTFQTDDGGDDDSPKLYGVKAL